MDRGYVYYSSHCLELPPPHTHTYTRSLSPTHRQVLMHTHVNTDMHSHRHTHTNTQIGTHVYIYRSTDTYSHTYTETHRRVLTGPHTPQVLSLPLLCLVLSPSPHSLFLSHILNAVTQCLPHTPHTPLLFVPPTSSSPSSLFHSPSSLPFPFFLHTCT